MKNNLIELLAALNTIEVRGNKNVRTLANCMVFLDKMIAECDVPKQPEKQNDKEQAE